MCKATILFPQSMTKNPPSQDLLGMTSSFWNHAGWGLHSVHFGAGDSKVIFSAKIR